MKWKKCRSWSFFFFQAEDGIRDYKVTGVQTCALPICDRRQLLRLQGSDRRARRDHDRRAEADPLRPFRLPVQDEHALPAVAGLALSQEIGRASCRERV